MRKVIRLCSDLNQGLTNSNDRLPQSSQDVNPLTTETYFSPFFQSNGTLLDLAVLKMKFLGKCTGTILMWCILLHPNDKMNRHCHPKIKVEMCFHHSYANVRPSSVVSTHSAYGEGPDHSLTLSTSQNPLKSRHLANYWLFCVVCDGIKSAKSATNPQERPKSFFYCMTYQGAMIPNKKYITFWWKRCKHWLIWWVQHTLPRHHGENCKL